MVAVPIDFQHSEISGNVTNHVDSMGGILFVNLGHFPYLCFRFPNVATLVCDQTLICK